MGSLKLNLFSFCRDHLLEWEGHGGQGRPALWICAPVLWFRQSSCTHAKISGKMSDICSCMRLKFKRINIFKSYFSDTMIAHLKAFFICITVESRSHFLKITWAFSPAISEAMHEVEYMLAFLSDTVLEFGRKVSSRYSLRLPDGELGDLPSDPQKVQICLVDFRIQVKVSLEASNTVFCHLHEMIRAY